MECFDNVSCPVVCNTTNCSSGIPPLSVTKAVFAGIELTLMFVIIAGNSLTIIAVHRFERLQTRTNQFLISLCVADLLVGLVMPFHAVYFLSTALNTNRWACVTRYVSVLLPCAASIFNLVLISVDRYIAILHPLRYHSILTHQNINILTASIWGYAAAVSSLPYFWHTWHPGQECRFEDVLPWQFLLFVMSTQYSILSLAMIILYGRIFLVAARHRNQIALMTLPQQTTEQDTQRKKDTKHARVLATVMGIFLCCWTPFFTTILVVQMSENKAKYLLDIRNIFTFLGVFNSSMNPFIYAWKNADFRSAFKKLLGMKCQPVQPQEHSTVNDNEERYRQHCSSNNLSRKTEQNETEEMPLENVMPPTTYNSPPNPHELLSYADINHDQRAIEMRFQSREISPCSASQCTEMTDQCPIPESDVQEKSASGLMDICIVEHHDIQIRSE